MNNIPILGTVVKYKGNHYTLKSCDLGGKCKIKKMFLPNKGAIKKDIDISELKQISFVEPFPIKKN